MDPFYDPDHYSGVTLENKITKLKDKLRDRMDIVQYEKSLSWEQASQLCRDAGGSLPYFTSRDELEEFIAFIKLEKYGILVNALFIGLHNKKVRFCLLAFAGYGTCHTTCRPKTPLSTGIANGSRAYINRE